MIKLDLSNVIEKIPFAEYEQKVSKINKMIDEKTGAGNDFLGWTTWPTDYDKEEFARIKKAAPVFSSIILLILLTFCSYSAKGIFSITFDKSNLIIFFLHFFKFYINPLL